MATYRAKGADGKAYRFDGPPGLSTKEASFFLDQYLNMGGMEPEAPVAAPVEQKGETGFIPSVIRGGRGLTSLLGDVAPAMLGKAVGAEDYARRQMEEAAAYQKETERLYPAEVASYKDIDSVGKALTYVKESIGEALPSILPSVITGGLAGVAGRGAQAAAMQAAEQVASRGVVKAMEAGPVQAATLEAIKKQALDAGIKEAEKVALKYQAAGALAGSAAQNVPDVYQNIYEATGKQDLGAALAFGAFNSALDAITPISLLRKMSKAGVSPEEVAAAWYKRAGKGAVQGFISEGGTEALQEVSSAAAEKFVDKNQQFFSEKNFERFINAGLKGGFGGAGITAATDVAFGKGPTAPPSTETQTQQTEQETPPGGEVTGEAPPETPLPPGGKGMAFTGNETLEALPEGFVMPAAQTAATAPAIDALQAEYDTRAKNIADAQSKPSLTAQEANTIKARIAKNEKLKTQIDAARAALVTKAESFGRYGEESTTGAQNVGQPIPPAGGEGASISSATNTNAPTGGIGGTQPARVVRPGENATGTNLGETGEPAAINRTVDDLLAAGEADQDVPDFTVPPAPAKKFEVRNKLEEFKKKKQDKLPSKGEGFDPELLEIAADADVDPSKYDSEEALIEAIEKSLAELDAWKNRISPAVVNAYEAAAAEHNAKFKAKAAGTVTPKFNDLLRENPDAVRIFLSNITGPDVAPLNTDIKSRLTLPFPEERKAALAKAIQKVGEHLDKKRSESEAVGRQATQLGQDKEAVQTLVKADAAMGVRYEDQRKLFPFIGTLPPWESLSRASKNLFGSANVNDTVLEQALALNLVKEQVELEAKGEKAKDAATDAEAIAIGQMYRQAQEERKNQPAGKGSMLPLGILVKLRRGDVKAALEYLRNEAKGIKIGKSKFGRVRYGYTVTEIADDIKDEVPFKIGNVLSLGDFEAYADRYGDSFTVEKKQISENTPQQQALMANKVFSSLVFKNLAEKLLDIKDFKVNVAFDPKLVFNTIGEYNYRTNTVILGPFGLDEATLLHELTHAATVRLIHKYYSDPNSLTKNQREAIKHLEDIASVAKSVITADKYKNAFDNLYEFVAYAMTDMEFQNELHKIQKPSLTKYTDKTAEQDPELVARRERGLRGYENLFDTLWGQFVGAIAHLYQLFRPNAKVTKYLVASENSKDDAAAIQDMREREAWETQVRDGANKKLLADAIERIKAEVINPAAMSFVGRNSASTNTALTEDSAAVRQAKQLIDKYNKKLVVVSEATRNPTGVEKRRGIKRVVGVYQLFDEINKIAAGIGITKLGLTPARLGSMAQKTPTEFSEAKGYEAPRRTKKQKDEELTEQERYDQAIELVEKESRGELTPAEKAAFDQEALYENPEELAKEAAITKGTEGKAKDVTSQLFRKAGVTNLDRIRNTEPGYRGNALMELFMATEDILAAPEGGITKLAGKEGFGETLPSKGAAKTVQATTPGQQSAEQMTAEAEKNVELKDRTPKVFFKNLFTKKGFQSAVEFFQNDRYPLKVLFDRARMFGLVTAVGENANDVYNAFSRSIGIAVHKYNTEVRSESIAVDKAVEAYANKLGIPVKEALSKLHLIMQARHEPERRHVKYLLNVPLDDNPTYKIGNEYYSAAAIRQNIIDTLTEPTPGLTDEQRTARAQKLRQMLETIVADPKSHLKIKNGKPVEAAYFNESNERYNVIAGRSPQEIQAFRDTLDRPEYKTEIDAVSQALRDLNKKTIKLNKEANYWSEPVANFVDFYGFKDYVPFKGRPENRTIDEEFNFDGKRLGGEFTKLQDPFKGRMSESENPILQSLADGASAALNAGRKILPETIVNAIKAGIIKGEPVDTIKFSDRYAGRTTRKDITGPNKIFLYKPDGTIDVWQINGKDMAEAIKRSTKTTNPLINMVDQITSGIGQTHTRYNPAFAPMNFVRDSFTNAGIIGAEFDPVTGGKLLSGMASDVANNGLARALNYSRLYADGKFDEIKRLAGGSKPYESLDEQERYYRDLADYVEMGGRVSYLQGVAARGALDELIKEVGRSGILKKKDQVDKFIDIYNDMFELSSRVAAYRLIKDEYYNQNLKNKMSPAEAKEDARIRAVEYAKNLANFEQIGRWGKQAGALFMFFRPAATGAVRAIEALAPAFSFNEEQFRKEAEAEGRTKAQIDQAVEIMKERQYAARRMMASMVGIGVAFYMMALMMAGDDDQGRNRIATDDMARWTRYARFFIPGIENPIQLPWGFGPGAFASAGAQIASLSTGRVSIAEAFSNIMTSGMDSFLPLPVSRISPIDNFPAWAMDSITPSAFRPFFEYVMIMDGLGREIYNNRQTRFGDAYTGGDNIPEAYKMAARMLFKATDGSVDWSPNTMYFFASNYADGAAKMATAATNLGLTVTGQKGFDPKNDMPLIGSFIGTKSNVDAREFSKVEEQVKAFDKRINALKDKPELLDSYLKTHENEYAAVQFYNDSVNGQLRQLRAAANQIRASDELTPRERKLQLEEINGISNIVKRQLLNTFEDMGVKP